MFKFIKTCGFILFCVFADGAWGVDGDDLAATFAAERDLDLAALKTRYERPAAPVAEPPKALVDLGLRLFFDTVFAADGVTSCASCHNPTMGWEDGVPRHMGLMGEPIARHSPTVIDSYAQAIYRWDGSAPSLAETSVRPFFDPAEMGVIDSDDLLDKLARAGGYEAAFETAFGDRAMSVERVGLALAAFQSAVRSGASPFDRWLAGESAAMTESAKRGFVLFNAKANCDACHGGWRFTEDGFHDIGLRTDDVGRYAIVPLYTMKHAFKTPTLRDIARRAPYMHDGSIESLEDVIKHYEDGFVRRESLSNEMQAFTLSDAERADLIAFLEALTSGPGSVVAQYAGDF